MASNDNRNARGSAMFRATGKDVFGCKAQLKSDGFRFVSGTGQYASEATGWYGTKEAVEKFKARGFRAKVFFQEVESCDALKSKV